MKKRHLKVGGFSLIELIIVIGIITTLLGCATIAFSTWIKKHDVEYQVKTLHADLLKTRAEAMNKNRDHFVVLNEKNYSIIADTDPGPFGDGVMSDADEVIRHETEFQYPINKSSVVTFNNRGLVPLSQARTICVPSDANPEVDCIKISWTKIRMGKITRQGEACSSDNCTTK